MTYDYDTFVYPVPEWYVIPKLTQVRSVETTPPVGTSLTVQSAPPVETFFTAQCDAPVYDSKVVTYYLDHDVTKMKPKPLEEINTVIYNVSTVGGVYPVAVSQGTGVWSAFTPFGGRMTIYTQEIERFDTTPPKGY